MEAFFMRLWIAFTFCIFTLNIYTNQPFPSPFSLHKTFILDLETDRFFLEENEGHHLAQVSERPFEIHSINEPSTFDNLNIVSGKSIFLFEHVDFVSSLSHFFHLIEHLIGVWNFYGVENPEDISTIVLAGDGKTELSRWEGPNELNLHLLKALFPNAEIYTYQSLKEHYQSHPLLFDEAIFSDRALTYFDPQVSHLNKMLGGVYQKIDANKLDQLAKKVHSYAGAELKASSKLRVSYINRNKKRYLLPRQKRELFRRIRELHNVELRVHYLEKLSFMQQVQIMKNTDVLIGIHGNGLSHTLFLPRDAFVIEFMPDNCLLFDYRMLAKMRGIKYYGLQGGRYAMGDDEAFKKGAYGNPNKIMKTVDIPLILEVIREKRAQKGI